MLKDNNFTGVRSYLLDRLRDNYTHWEKGLDTETGLAAMCLVNEGFSFKKGIMTVHKDRRQQWVSLETVLQQKKPLPPASA